VNEDQHADEWVERLTSAGAQREQAIAELHALLVRGLRKSLSGRYGGRLPVEDVAQEAVLKVLASLETFAGRSRFTTWAMTIAIRLGISQARRKHFRDVSLDAIGTGEGLKIPVADEPAPDEGLDHQQLLQTLRELIETRLTDKQREATQALLHGLPVEEIARRTGSNRNAVYKLVHDARLRLKEGFAQAGIQADDVSAVLA